MALSTISGTTGITDATVTSAKLADFTAAVDLNGVELLLDADADTSISADTDDQIDIKIANTDHLKILSSSGDTVLKPMVDAKDIIFQQFDGNKIFCIDDGNFVSVGGNATAPGEIRIYEDTDNGSHYSGFKVGNLTSSVAYQLPNTDGSNTQVLTTNGSGVLTWATASANTPSSADAEALGSASLEWSDLFLADASTIQFGADQDVILTHVADTGLLLSGTNVIQFNDASQNIGAPTNAILDINATDEIELNATLVDVNGNLDVSGTITIGSAAIAEAELELLDGLTAGTAIASKVVTTDASIDTTGQRNLTISGELDAATLDISGAIDIAGASQFSSTITVGANDQGYDIIIYGDTASANLTWDTSVDDLIFNGAARAVIPDGQLVLGSTAVTSTAAELNKLDGAGTIKQAGKETIWIPAVAMYPSNTSGCAALAGTELASDINRPFLQVLAFDKDSDEAAQFSVAFPKSWNEGTITFQPFFTANTTNTGDVKFMVKGIAISDDDALNTDFGTAQGTAKSHSGTAYDLNVGAESSAITIAGSPAAGDQVFFQIFRDVSADNMSADALLTGVKIHFTTDAANDA